MVISWLTLLGGLGFFVAVLYCYRLYLTGWGDGARSLRAQRGDSYVLFFARVGVVFLPGTAASGFGLSGMLLMKIHQDLAWLPALIGGGICLFLAFGCALWGIKELWAPSPSRRRPQWIDELEAEFRA